MPEFERIVIGQGDSAEGTLLVGPEHVWFVSLVDHVVGVLDGDRTYLAHSRRPIEQRSGALGVPPEEAGNPARGPPGSPFLAAPPPRLAAREGRSGPSPPPRAPPGQGHLAA